LGRRPLAVDAAAPRGRLIVMTASMKRLAPLVALWLLWSVLLLAVAWVRWPKDGPEIMRRFGRYADHWRR